MRNLFKELMQCMRELREGKVPLQHYYYRETPHCDEAKEVATPFGTSMWMCSHEEEVE